MPQVAVTPNKRTKKASGFSEVAEKRRLIHFDWLALHQVKRWSWAQIADWDQEQGGEETIGEDAIRKGVLDAANLCKLNARQRKPGRPKNRKE